LGLNGVIIKYCFQMISLSSIFIIFIYYFCSFSYLLGQIVRDDILIVGDPLHCQGCGTGGGDNSYIAGCSGVVICIGRGLAKEMWPPNLSRD
jgi:hypothetical protein